MDDNTAAIKTEQATRVSANLTLAKQTATLAAKVDGNTAAVQTQATVINGLSAQYMVKLDVNGYVSGYGLYNSGGTSQFLIHADRFAIGRPGVAARYPFIVDNGQVVIDTAVIREGSIQQGKIGPISFGKITDAAGNPVTAVGGKLKAQYIESDGIVTSYLSANTGFIKTAHIGNAAITRAKIGDLAVDTLKLAGNAVTIPKFASIRSPIHGNGGSQLAIELWFDVPAGSWLFASFTGYLGYGYGWRQANTSLYIGGQLVSTGGGAEAWTCAAHSGGVYFGSGGVVRVHVEFYGQDNRVGLSERSLYAMVVRR